MGLLKDFRSWRHGTRTRRRLRDLTGSLVVVTGAGSGIGRETALAFAAQGAVLVLCDVDLESAQDTAALIDGPAHSYQVDVADEEAVIRFAATVSANHGIPDIVVNNAGIGYSGTFADTPQDQFERVMNVNFWGVVHGCRAFSPMMIERGTGGHVVNLSSAAAYTPQKTLTAYSTSKAAVFMFSDCLRAELLPHGIGVSTICPGLVHTNIVKNTEFGGTTAEEQTRLQTRADNLYRRRNFTPDRVATAVVKAVRSNKAVVPVTPEAKIGRALSRLSPGAMRVGARLKVT
ncbi:NAD(P)-dependent dehydrogenase (short-subunit alcohol dehydrogenase family) [Rhodococcus sp. 27YEA15]|uniref:SDR family NAD(P)-dependent oxidoreductase n=1 Tax=Rhodococcus sp. 27YEA15 TaxID=3156259 RepID=UPI003C7B9BE7